MRPNQPQKQKSQQTTLKQARPKNDQKLETEISVMYKYLTSFMNYVGYVSEWRSSPLKKTLKNTFGPNF